MPENLRFRRPERGREVRDIRPVTSERFAALANRVIPGGLQGSQDYVDRSVGRWIFATVRNQEFGLPETSRVVHEATAYWRLPVAEIRVEGFVKPVKIDYVMEVTINNEGLLKLGRPDREGYTEDADTVYNSQLPRQEFVELAEVDLFARQALEQYGFSLPSPETQILPQNLYHMDESAQDQLIGMMHGSHDVLAQRILSDEELNQAIDFLERAVAAAQGN